MKKFLNARLLLVPISVGAFLATWGGWAKLATMTGYQEVEMLGGQEWSRFNIGIVLPMTVEPFGAFAAKVAFDPAVKRWARIIAGIMAVLTLVAAGICQAVVHHLTVTGVTRAPDYVVTVTSVLPVIVLGLGGALAMLSKVHNGDEETPKETTGMGFLGRIGNALGDAAATRAERFAETAKLSQPVPAHVPAAAQDEPSDLSQDTAASVPGPRAEASHRPTQTVSDTRPPTPALAVPPRGTANVPAAQDPETTAVNKASRDEQIRQIHAWRSESPRVSYAEIGRRLGVSKSEAGRLGQEAEALYGTTTPILKTVPFELPGRETETVPAVNGHHPTLTEETR